METKESENNQNSGSCDQIYTAKDLKKILRYEFEEHSSKYYPYKVFEENGFSRHQCPACGHFYWRHSDKAVTCGDSSCKGEYTFIGGNISKWKEVHGKMMTPSDAWEGFKRVMTTTKPPHTALQRYPVVARWRNDCYFTGAGIQCYQPYCVTGECEPPANPLIQTQFCFRFNDLDSIGLSGRHYSGFTMIGIQVFNTPGHFVYWADDLVRNNLRWLTEELLVDPDEITFIEDVWAGGGNLGPCIEYFVGGLELGNMVLTQFATHDVKKNVDPRKVPITDFIEELKCRVIDVGIGLERVPWLINGDSSSYPINFGSAFTYLKDTLNNLYTAKGLTERIINVDDPVYTSFAKYSCLLNMDELDFLDKEKDYTEDGQPDVYRYLARTLNIDRDRICKVLRDISSIYVVLDHLRTFLISIIDTQLPGNVGGGYNIREVLRRAFSVFEKLLRVDDKTMLVDKKEMLEIMMKTMEEHANELAKIHGKTVDIKTALPGEKNIETTLKTVLEIEYQKYIQANKDGVKKLDALLEKNVKDMKLAKGTKYLSINDWLLLTGTYGLTADIISEHTGLEIPTTLYSEAEYRNSSNVNSVTKQKEGCCDDDDEENEKDNNKNNSNKKASTINKNTLVLSEVPTEMLIYSAEEYTTTHSSGELLGIFKEQNGTEHLVLSRSVFYITQGGQEHDNADIILNFKDKEVKVRCEGGIMLPNGVLLHTITTSVKENLESSGVVFEQDKTTSEYFRVVKNNNTENTIEADVNVDVERRYSLIRMHSGAHVLSAACRYVLGTHVNQCGARKTETFGTLDITHHSTILDEIATEGPNAGINEMRRIEQVANEIIRGKFKGMEAEGPNGFPLTKKEYLKSDAEKKYGMRIYQGGAVPGNSVRIVTIGTDDALIDAEACCGTHAPNTGFLKCLKIIKCRRISDGVVRITFTTGSHAILAWEQEHTAVVSVCNLFGIDPCVDDTNLTSKGSMFGTVSRIFADYKTAEKECGTLREQVLELRLDMLSRNKEDKILAFTVGDSVPTIYVAAVPRIASALTTVKDDEERACLFLGPGYCIGASIDAKTDGVISKLFEGMSVKASPVKVKARGKKDASQTSIAASAKQHCVFKLTAEQRVQLIERMKENNVVLK